MLRALLLKLVMWFFAGLGLVMFLLAVVAVIAGLVALTWALMPVNKVPLSYNLRNLQARWKTTFLTALAFTMVVGLLTVMLSFVRAMYRMTQESGVPGNVM